VWHRDADHNGCHHRSVRQLDAAEWYATRQAARTAIFEYVEGYYNRVRRHSTLGYLSQVEFEERAAHSTSGVY